MPVKTDSKILSDAKKKGVNLKSIKTSASIKRVDKSLNKTIPELKKELKDLHIKGYSRLNKKELLNKVIPGIENISDELRKHRTHNINNNTITQRGILEKSNFWVYSENWKSLYISQHIKDYILEARDNLFKDVNVITSYVKPLYVFDAFGYDDDEIKENRPVVIRFGTMSEKLDKTTTKENLQLVATVNNSADRILYIGYQIVYQLKHGNKIKNRNLNFLKAYSQCTDYKYHRVCTASTSTSKICIYETFLHIQDISKLQYKSKDKKIYKDTLYNRLKDEGEEIEDAVKSGEVVKSLCLLSKKYDTNLVLIFYGYYKGLLTIHEFDKPDIIDYDLLNEFPLWFKNGEKVDYYELKEVEAKHEITFDEELLEELKDLLKEKEVFLYSQEHVSPTTYKKYSGSREKELVTKLNDKENFIYKLGPIDKRNFSIVNNVLGFDIETYTDKNYNAVPFNLTVYGRLTIKKHCFDNKEVKMSFYGLDCIEKFVDFLELISTPSSNMKKTNSKKKDIEGKIYVYGFNNSNFDNLLTIKTLHEKIGYEKNIISGNSIKMITFANIKIMDISSYYSGRLSDVAGAKGFNLAIQKGVYPYRFPNKDNLKYIGEVPDIKYWNSPEDRELYIRETGNIFNLEKYTEKYCMLDSKLVYQIAIIHLRNCKGIINGRKYDTSQCPTGANIALKMFTQCFLDELLTASPKSIRDIERKSYFGGRTEVFKKEYQSDNINKGGLYYLDINSAHPSGMLKEMPFRYQRTLKLRIPDTKLEIVDYYIYRVKVSYKGNDPFYIPNLLCRNKNNIVGVKNTDYIYCWGIELNEAVKDGCIYECDEILIYEGKAIFKTFSEFFYNERLKIKGENPTLAQFFKTVMNSLYGKFGQQPHTTKVIIKHPDEISSYVNDNCKRVVNINIIQDNYMILEYEDILDDVNNIGNLIRFSSYIACTTRCKLAEVMRDVGHKNVYYCDTDSIFSLTVPSNKYMSDTILGKWKIECKPIIEAYFLAPKMYYYKTEDNKVQNKAKGIKSDKLNKVDYTNMLHNGALVGQNKLLFFRSLDGVKIKDVNRHVQTVYNKRQWNGNESEAFDNVDEWLKAR